MNKPAWPRERIEEMLATGRFGYQRIELPHGLCTPGTDRRATADAIFPADLTGKTVLDLGCNHGYFCFEALRRGAARAVGYEHDPQIVQRATLLAEAKGVDAEFRQWDLNTQPLVEQFDYVLCLNVLHHLRNPLLRLEQMMAVTRECLALELAGMSLFDCFHTLEMQPLFALTAWLLTPFPVMFIGRTPGRKQPGAPERLKYYFTRRAMQRLFAEQKERFPRVEFLPSSFKSRYMLIARRDA